MRHATLKLGSAIAVALAAVSPTASAQILFSDNYDAGTSGANYDVFTANPASNGSANFAENYANLRYEVLDSEANTIELPIPSAPRSTGGSTIGAVMRVNDNIPSGQLNTVSAFPKLQSFSGNYKLVFDMWINYNGLAEGLAASTEWMLAGINQNVQGANPIAGPILTGTIGGNIAGNTFANNGERGNGQDYRTYVNQANQGVRGFAAPNTVPPPGASNQQNGELNPYYADSTTGLFPAPEFQTFGAPGKHWVTVEMSQQAGVLTWKINNNHSTNPQTKVISQYVDITNTSGNITLGYADFATSASGPVEAPYQFIVYDNVEVSAVDVDLYWDINGAGTAGGGGATPAGNWDGVALNFNSDSTGGAAGVVTPFTSNNEDVHFAAGSDGGGTYTVTVTGAKTAKSVNIDRGNVTLNGGPITTPTFHVASGATGTITGNVAGVAGSMAKTGAGTLAINRLPQNTAINIAAGTLRVLHSPPAGTDPESGTNTSVSQPSSLSVAAGATLDITNNDVIIDYSGASPAAVYEALVASGYNVTGDWQGDGITSSTAAADGNYVVAIADNATLAAPFGTAQGGALFAGVNVDLDTILIKFTHRADINLDGLVTPDDSAVFGGGYDEAITSGHTWAAGDMNYDGMCTPDDAAIFGGAYDESLTSLPEPASVGALALLAAIGMGRRRSRRS